MRPKPVSTGAALIVLALTLAACGSTAKTGSAAPSGTHGFPITVGQAKITELPTRVISLSPTATETLYAVGAGSQVLAVDDQSNYPAQAPKTKLSGFQPNAEAILAYNPDLVVLADNTNGVVNALRAAHVAVLQEPAAANLDQAYEEIEEIGAATGHGTQADAVVGDMKERITEAVARVPKPAKQLTYYHELDSTYYTATSNTFIGNVYALFGLKNIADSADKPGTGAYPQLQAEAIVQDAPDLIFLADAKYGGQTPAVVAARPGWSGIPAVRNGNVIALDDDIASRWGPRIVDLVDEIGNAMDKASGAQ